MSEQTLSLRTAVVITLNGEKSEVEIIASSAEDLLNTVAKLTGQVPVAQEAPVPSAVTEAAPNTQAAAQETPPTQTAPTATPAAQPAPTGAATAPPPAAGASATPTGTPSNQAAQTHPTAQPAPPAGDDALPKCLEIARGLLGQQGGREKLQAILSEFGQTSLSTTPKDQLPGILAKLQTL